MIFRDVFCWWYCEPAMSPRSWFAYCLPSTCWSHAWRSCAWLGECFNFWHSAAMQRCNDASWAFRRDSWWLIYIYIYYIYIYGHISELHGFLAFLTGLLCFAQGQLLLHSEPYTRGMECFSSSMPANADSWEFALRLMSCAYWQVGIWWNSTAWSLVDDRGCSCQISCLSHSRHL